MDIIFLRHGEAERADGKPDADRELVDEGRRQARRAAEALRAMKLRPGRVLSSPLVRARQTADAVAAEFRLPKVEIVDWLAPPGDAVDCRKAIERLLRDGVKCVVLAGHTPSLEDLAGALVAGAKMNMSLPKGGMACVCAGDDGEMELRWLLRREQIAAVARRS